MGAAVVDDKAHPISTPAEKRAGGELLGFRRAPGDDPRFHEIAVAELMRFRQIAYQLAFDTNGSTDNAPVRLFQLQTYVAAKETVVKKNS